MDRERKKRYQLLREIRQIRDFEIGLKPTGPYRPYGGFPSLFMPGRNRAAVTTKKFMKMFCPSTKGVKVLSPSETKELLAQNKIPTYKCNVKK
jgi:hypothetical protein